MSDLQPQPSRLNFSWSVDTGVGKVVSIGTDLLRACTSDNVQPLALLACEKLGAQLAMCPETRVKMEQAGRRKHTSYILKSLGASIGYMAGDSADYLASTDAGTRFLGLAATLLTTGLNFDAAQTLHTLLKEFAPKDQMLPTIGQLKQLFEILEPKLKCSGRNHGETLSFRLP
ncbi:hypothetical protein EDD37DRAFT_433515 [Exophiala viscosa]|uniref:uncharacterized protein n=1 Tax=Exophiala viscosa TaxID=2486360 RepID=UPI00218D2571|nr:hypothetical protein EDD37DRAFT_433515 [Exophiala viscosa]